MMQDHIEKMKGSDDMIKMEEKKQAETGTRHDMQPLPPPFSSAPSLLLLLYQSVLLLLLCFHAFNTSLVTPAEQRCRINIRMGVILVIRHLSIQILLIISHYSSITVKKGHVDTLCTT